MLPTARLLFSFVELMLRFSRRFVALSSCRFSGLRPLAILIDYTQRFSIKFQLHKTELDIAAFRSSDEYCCLKRLYFCTFYFFYVCFFILHFFAIT